MARKLSTIAPDWWDYTTLEDDLISDAASLTAKDLEQLSRPGFRVVMYDTLEDFYLAEALEYISSWKEATSDNPVGICGPIGPTEQLPLVARLVNELKLNLSDAHFWGMDEWLGDDGKDVPTSHPLYFERADRELCFERIDDELKIEVKSKEKTQKDLAALENASQQVSKVMQTLKKQFEDAKAELNISIDDRNKAERLLEAEKTEHEKLKEDLEFLRGTTIGSEEDTERKIKAMEIEIPKEREMAEEMNAEDPLFILYTSGSTGKPKGVLHTTGGYMVYASMTCLLYTSPSPRDKRQSRMPSSA